VELHEFLDTDEDSKSHLDTVEEAEKVHVCYFMKDEVLIRKWKEIADISKNMCALIQHHLFLLYHVAIKGLFMAKATAHEEQKTCIFLFILFITSLLGDNWVHYSFVTSDVELMHTCFC
jgi:hypothetical protein